MKGQNVSRTVMLVLLTMFFAWRTPARAQQLIGTLDFGAQFVGTDSTPQKLNGCCHNPNSTFLTYTFKMTGDFQRHSSSTCTCINCTSTLGAGQSCDMWVFFRPGSTGPKTGTVTYHQVGINTDSVWNLTGIGIFPPPPPPCDVNKDGKTDVLDVQLIVNQAARSLTRNIRHQWGWFCEMCWTFSGRSMLLWDMGVILAG